MLEGKKIFMSSAPYTAFGIASAIFPNSVIMFAEVDAVPVTSFTSESAPNVVTNPSNSPSVAFVPVQMFCSIFSATFPATCPINQSEKIGGKSWLIAE